MLRTHCREAERKQVTILDSQERGDGGLCDGGSGRGTGGIRFKILQSCQNLLKDWMQDMREKETPD